MYAPWCIVTDRLVFEISAPTSRCPPYLCSRRIYKFGVFAKVWHVSSVILCQIGTGSMRNCPLQAAGDSPSVFAISPHLLHPGDISGKLCCRSVLTSILDCPVREPVTSSDFVRVTLKQASLLYLSFVASHQNITQQGLRSPPVRQFAYLT